eukprot:17617_1
MVLLAIVVFQFCFPASIKQWQLHMLSKRTELKEEDLIGIKDDDTLLVEPCELVAPMTRIRGKFKLTTVSITFVPDQLQPDKPGTSHRINLAQHPPPLYASKSTSPTCTVYKPMETQTINTLSLSNDPNNTNEDERSKSQLEAMVLNCNNSNKKKLNDYWIAVNACSSYQQVGGTRYRLVNAHRFWFVEEVTEMYFRRYQLRSCAFELFFNDDTSWLFSFYDTEYRNKVFDAIISLKPPNLIESIDFFKNPQEAIKSSCIHHKWCRREISNFEYLMRLNTFAGRTFNDLTQYPVVPWVITDFTSPELDLNDPLIFRDLSKPIGALDAGSLSKFMERFESLKEDEDSTDCFMYGTHYSSIGTVLYYLLRMQPFTTYNLHFQDGKYDTADRLFHSVRDTFVGCLKNTGDVKELIPEFYYMTDFLCNKQCLLLGKRQSDGVFVNDVKLPPWAHQSPQTFIVTMRSALESEHVSAHLHEWIDLIFGYKQRGVEAEKAFNVFHPYTYEGNVNIDQMEDQIQKMAILSQIDEYGQTPQQLFTEAHPSRFKENCHVLSTVFKSHTLRCYAHYQAAATAIVGMALRPHSIVTIRSDYCVDIHKWSASRLSIQRIHNDALSPLNLLHKLFNKTDTTNANRIGGDISLKIIDGNACFAITSDGAFAFCCGFADHSFVVWDITNSKMVQRCTRHGGVVSCLALDEDVSKQKVVLVTGSYDQSVIVWQVNVNQNLKPKHILVNQLSPILCVDMSLKSGIIVCCSVDGMVNVYNSSTGDHYYMLQPFVDKTIQKWDSKKDHIESSMINIVRVSHVFGYILCYSKQTKDIFLYSSSNGKMIANASSANDVYNDIQFSKSANYIVCGGRNAFIRIKHLPSFKTTKKFKEATSKEGAITSIYIEPKNETSLFVGTANGNIFVYSLPQKAFVDVRIGTLDRHGF